MNFNETFKCNQCAIKLRFFINLHYICVYVYTSISLLIFTLTFEQEIIILIAKYEYMNFLINLYCDVW